MELHFLNGFYVFHGILLVAINKHFGTACRITEFIQLCMSETDVFHFFSKFPPMSHVIAWSRMSYTHSTHHLLFPQRQVWWNFDTTNRFKHDTSN